MSEPKQMLCPSCNNKPIGGKFCPECGAELIDPNTARPNEQWTNELIEKTAQRTAEILREGVKPDEETGKTDEPKKGFFGRS